MFAQTSKSVTFEITNIPVIQGKVLLSIIPVIQGKVLLSIEKGLYYGMKDVDSIAGNKSTSEDDYSTANIILGVKTGQVFIYVTLTLTIIAIIGVGTYLIKKRVLK